MTATVIRTHLREGWCEYSAAELSCGHWTTDVPVGAEVECGECDREQAARAAVRLAHDAGSLSHTRAARVGGPGIDVYVRDDTSPTGVRHLTRLNDTEENVTFLRSLSRGYSPLSPTEG
jgi:hypothetical protein